MNETQREIRARMKRNDPFIRRKAAVETVSANTGLDYKELAAAAKAVWRAVGGSSDAFADALLVASVALQAARGVREREEG